MKQIPGLSLLERNKMKILVRNRAVLVSMIKPCRLIERLMATSCFTMKDKQLIEFKTTSDDQSASLVDFLTNSGSSKVHAVFCQCLRETDQTRVVNILEEGGVLVAVQMDINPSKPTPDISFLMTGIDDKLKRMLWALQRDFRAPSTAWKKLETKYIAKFREKRLEIVHARLSDSNRLVVYVWCKTEASMVDLGKVMDTGCLRFQLEAFLKHFSEKADLGYSVRTFVDPKEFENAETYFSCSDTEFRIRPIVNKQLCVLSSLRMTDTSRQTLLVDLPGELVSLIIKKASLFFYLLHSVSTSHPAERTFSSLTLVSCFFNTLTREPSTLTAIARHVRRLCRPYTRRRLRRVTRLTIEQGAVRGVALLLGRIYIACASHDALITYQPDTPHHRLDDVTLEATNDETGLPDPGDLVACPTLNSLYLTDIQHECIWKIDISEKSDKPQIERWKEEIGEPFTLSVASDGLVIVPSRGCLEIFQPNGVLFRRVDLPKASDAIHVIQTPKGTWIVCGQSEDPKLRFYEISSTGEFLRAFPGELDSPEYLAADAIHGLVFVVDHRTEDESVLLVDDRLVPCRVLLTRRDGDRLEGPCRVAFHAGSMLLLIGLDLEEEAGLSGGGVDIYCLRKTLNK